MVVWIEQETVEEKVVGKKVVEKFVVEEKVVEKFVEEKSVDVEMFEFEETVTVVVVQVALRSVLMVVVEICSLETVVIVRKSSTDQNLCLVEFEESVAQSSFSEHSPDGTVVVVDGTVVVVVDLNLVTMDWFDHF